jgi:hypothetical protein
VVALEQVVQEISLFDIFIECNGANFAGDERVFDISVLYSFQQLFNLLVLAVFWKLVSGIYGLSRAARRSGGIAVSSTFSRTFSACNDSSLCHFLALTTNKICL